MIRSSWLLLAVLAACGPGPTVYFGRAPDAAAPEAGSPTPDASTDAGDEPDEDQQGDNDDDRPMPCWDPSDCDRDAPFCDPRRFICVECLHDDQCRREEQCLAGFCDDSH
ncbi:MAG: hypothetical protein QM778_33455 [Myxococcales bacterium]